MLRATSEIAVAISVRSVDEKPNSVANRRPTWRATTTSASDLIGTRASSSATVAQLPRLLEELKPLFEVKRRVHVLQCHAELDHRESDLRLDADDHRLGTAQLGHVRDAAQRARDERIHHVECRHIDDD